MIGFFRTAVCMSPKSKMVTAIHGHSQPQRSHKCAVGLLVKNWIFEGEGIGVVERFSGFRTEQEKTVSACHNQVARSVLKVKKLVHI
ncbi:hypothetical protein EVAR_63276_1 [Eumeta japonica]|uniref:Uncharacterized protein n=1 Tax=Eumeta variegata TaxID=151549 RepID=A0A4C1YW49_EUMVA|nr:hypothetical protein EVAR_63276_1 [Eumeta japonica]